VGCCHSSDSDSKGKGNLGLYLEDFELNRTSRTRGRTIGEGDVSLFAGLVGDYNPLHVDEDFSKKEGLFGGRVAHGPLVLSTAIGLMSQLNWIDGTALGLLGISWDFRSPVKLGDTISAKVTPLEARPSNAPARGILKIGFEVLNQREEIVQTGSIVLLMRRRPGRTE
jgi:acyl dehydratase